MRYAALSTHVYCRHLQAEPPTLQRRGLLGPDLSERTDPMGKLPRRKPELKRRSDQNAEKPKPLSSEVGKDRKDIKSPWRPGLVPKDKS